MEWQFTVTNQLYSFITRQEISGNFKQRRAESKSKKMLSIIILLFAVCYLTVLFNGNIFDHLILLITSDTFILVLLYVFFTFLLHIITKLQNRSMIRSGFCRCRVDEDWFYYMLTLPGSQNTYFQEPLKNITRTNLQGNGLLLEFSSIKHVFLPAEAFSSCPAAESQDFLRKACLNALQKDETAEPLSRPFADMFQFSETELYSCSFQIPKADITQIYTQCMQNLFRHGFYYIENKVFYFPLLLIIVIYFIIFLAGQEWDYLSLALSFLLLEFLFIFLKRNSIRKQAQKTDLSYFTKPQKISIYPEFLTVSTSDSVTAFYYRRLCGVYGTAISYYIAVKNPLSLFFLPCKAFSSAEEEAVFIRCLQAKIKEN